MTSLSLRQTSTRSPSRSPSISLLSLLLVVYAVGWTRSYASYAEAATTAYFHVLFESAFELPPAVDGVSGVGVMCRPGADIAVPQMDTIVLSDMCGSGSAIRKINRNGISTISGSLDETGFTDGIASVARFNGFSQGNARVNGLCYAMDYFFLADTGNNVIRRIDPSTGNVTTFISSASQLDSKPLNYPNFVAAYQQKDSSSNTQTLLFISDTSNSRILFTPIQFDVVPPLTLAKDGFQPGMLSVSSNLKTLYYTANTDSVRALNLETNKAMIIGESTCTGYISAMQISYDNTEVLYFGQHDTEIGIYSLPVSGSGSTAGDGTSWCGSLKFAWPYTDHVRAIAVRNFISYYVMTDYSVYILSTQDLYFPPANALENRIEVVIGLPIYVLPINNNCLMSQFYAWLRKDSSVALQTEDYYNQFTPLDDFSLLVNGTVNVSTWCSRLSEKTLSTDGSVLLLEYYGEADQSAEEIYSVLRNSTWNYTKSFLNSLYDSSEGSGSGANAGPFCLVNCTGETACLKASTNNSTKYCDYLIPDPDPSPSPSPSPEPNTTRPCDEVCVGGIVSASVMGTVLIGLVVLAILSPPNVFNAFFMFPVI